MRYQDARNVTASEVMARSRAVRVFKTVFVNKWSELNSYRWGPVLEAANEGNLRMVRMVSQRRAVQVWVWLC
jgi:hypothetical protein